MMPMLWMLMAQTIMSAIATACFSLSPGERNSDPCLRQDAALHWEGSRACYARPCEQQRERQQWRGAGDLVWRPSSAWPRVWRQGCSGHSVRRRAAARGRRTF